MRNCSQTLINRNLLQVASRMEVQPVQAKLLTTVHLFNESRSRLLKAFLSRAAKIDKVAVMRKYLRCSIAILCTIILEQPNLLICKRFCHPLLLVLGKQCKSRCSNTVCVQRSIPYTTACTYMCSYIFHKIASYFSANLRN